MKAFKGLLWALLIYAMLWAVLMFGIASVCHEVDMRREKVENKAKVYQWWHERDLNTYLTQKNGNGYHNQSAR